MKLLKFFAAISATVLLFTIAVFIFRQQILLAALDHFEARVKKNYNCELRVSSIRFTGYRTIILSGLSLKHENASPLLNIQDAEARLSSLSLLKGGPGFSELKLSGVFINVLSTDDSNNIRLFQKAGSLIPAESSPATNYRKRVERWERGWLQALGISFSISDLNLNYTDSADTEKIYAPHIDYDGTHLSALVINRQSPDTFLIDGIISHKGQIFKFNVERTGAGTGYLPFPGREKNLKCAFESFSGQWRMDDTQREFRLQFNVSLKNFRVNYWRLAKGDVELNSAQMTGLLQIGEQAVEVDSSTELRLNGAKCRLFVNYHMAPDTTLALALNMPEIPSDTFFGALPVNAFNTLKGISCSGTLAYNLRFSIDTRQPDSLLFLSALSRKNFHINHYGEENFGRVNQPFTYYAYSNGQLMRQIEVGPANPLFAPLGQISPLLVTCVLQSEDPSFMTHRGFLPESFRESIAQDYREKRFARGGSTISMQFVKNVFLSRDKTVSRKVQEALIVYLIENLGLVSKERMLEIYLNVIEWGPDVYGIGEAAKFYFNKKPSELNLQECLFLAAIIPNPRYFKYQFDKDGHLKTYMADYFKLLCARLAKRNLIPDSELEQLQPHVKLTGPASRLVMPADSLPPPEEGPETE